jgi:hypothetical protein
MRVRKKSPIRRETPAKQKIQPNATRESLLHSTICPAVRIAANVQAPKTRLRRAKYFPLSRSGTSSEIAEDQATLAMLFAAVAIKRVMTKSRLLPPEKAEMAPFNAQGRPPSVKVINSN